MMEPSGWRWMKGEPTSPPVFKPPEKRRITSSEGGRRKTEFRLKSTLVCVINLFILLRTGPAPWRRLVLKQGLALLRKAMRCPAVPMGLPDLLLMLPEIKEEERKKSAPKKRLREEYILTGGGDPPSSPSSPNWARLHSPSPTQRHQRNYHLVKRW